MEGNTKTPGPAKALAPLIRIPQEFVHIRHDFTLLQYKYLLLMFHAGKEMPESERPEGWEHTCLMSVRRLSELLGYSPGYPAIRKSLDALRKGPMIFNLLGKDGRPSSRSSGIISEWCAIDGFASVQYPSFVREILDCIDDEGSMSLLLDWKIFSRFKRKFDAVLYLLCKDYEQAGTTGWIGAETFRDYLGLGPDSYPESSRFKRRCVIDPVDRINGSWFSDIRIEAELREEDGTFVGVRFTVVTKRTGDGA